MTIGSMPWYLYKHVALMPWDASVAIKTLILIRNIWETATNRHAGPDTATIAS